LLDLDREQRRLALELPAQGFPSNSLSDPNAPELYSLNPRLVTPYTSSGTLVWSTNYPPTPFSKFPTAVLAD